MKTNTKIIATLGPSCSDPKVIDKMINNDNKIKNDFKEKNINAENFSKKLKKL